MSSGADSDLVGHFQAGVEVLKRYPILVAPPLVAQLILFVLTLVLMGGVAGMAVVGGVVGGLAGVFAGGVVFMVVGSLLSLIAAGVVIMMARDALAAREPILGDALNAVMGRFVDVLIASFLSTVIVGIGLVLLLIPGLIAAFFLIFTLPAVLLDGQGAVDGLRRSASVVKGNVGAVGGLVVGAILAIVVSVVIEMIFHLVPILGSLAAAVVRGALISYLTVVGVRIYQALPRA